MRSGFSSHTSKAGVPDPDSRVAPSPLGLGDRGAGFGERLGCDSRTRLPTPDSRSPDPRPPTPAPWSLAPDPCRRPDEESRSENREFECGSTRGTKNSQPGNGPEY